MRGIEFTTLNNKNKIYKTTLQHYRIIAFNSLNGMIKLMKIDKTSTQRFEIETHILNLIDRVRSGKIIITNPSFFNSTSVIPQTEPSYKLKPATLCNPCGTTKGTTITETEKERLKQQSLQKSYNIVDEMRRNAVHIVVANTSKKIIVFIEDSKSGFKFLEVYFRSCYPSADITLVPLGGHSNMKYISYYNHDIGFDYDFVIIVYDRGRSNAQFEISDNNRTGVLNAIKRIKKTNCNAKIFIFSPLCFESIVLSCSLLFTLFLQKYNLSTRQYSTLYSDLTKLLNNQITEIDWSKYITDTKLSIENIIENDIEEITHDTKYEILHKPSNISKCWLKECSGSCDETDNYCSDIRLDVLEAKNKMSVIAASSALGGLSYIMDKIFNITTGKYPQGLIINKTYRDKLITEVF